MDAKLFNRTLAKQVKQHIVRTVHQGHTGFNLKTMIPYSQSRCGICHIHNMKEKSCDRLNSYQKV